MEKLKAKHDHKLTDILKVAIFGLMLILPCLILLPSMLYYGVNEHATAPTEQVEKVEYERVNFNQLAENIHNKEFVIEGWRTNSSYTDPLVYVYIYNLSEHVNHIFYGKANINSDYNITNIQNSNSLIGRFVLNSSDLTNVNLIGALTREDINNEYTGQTYITYQLFDLTLMFGIGNEPTIQEFNSWYTKEYYEYTESRYEILEKPTGTYETYTDITSQIQFNWNSLWKQPLFSWTNYTILKQGLDNFTYVLGITQTSYINNLIVYELIIVVIYIVIDIVLTLFKWLTHLIGEK